MLTHTIIVKPPIEQKKVYHQTSRKLRRDEKRMRARLNQDLKNRQIQVGDTVYAEGYGYGQVMEILTQFDQISEWEGTAPLNVLVWVYDDQTEYFFNVFALHKA